MRMLCRFRTPTTSMRCLIEVGCCKRVWAGGKVAGATMRWWLSRVWRAEVKGGRSGVNVCTMADKGHWDGMVLCFSFFAILIWAL